MKKIKDKKKMVKVSIPDMVEGRAPIPQKYESIKFLQKYMSLHSEIVAEREQLRCKTQNAVDILHSIPEEYKELALTALRVQCGFVKTRRICSFSKPLQQAFYATHLNVKTKTLPASFSGYFDFRRNDLGFKTKNTHPIHGDFKAPVLLIGAYVDLTDNRLSMLVLTEIIPNGELGVNYVSYDIDEAETVKEVMENHPCTFDKTFIPLVNFILTALLYVTTKDADILKSVNEFPRSEKKTTTLKKFYTDCEVWSVGENYQLPPQYSDKTIVRKGHFGFRWCGVGRTELKYTWISESKPFKRQVKD